MRAAHPPPCVPPRLPVPLRRHLVNVNTLMRALEARYSEEHVKLRLVYMEVSGWVDGHHGGLLQQLLLPLLLGGWVGGQGGVGRRARKGRRKVEGAVVVLTLHFASSQKPAHHRPPEPAASPAPPAPQGLSLKQQAALWSSASVVVHVHGASLANYYMLPVRGGVGATKQ